MVYATRVYQAAKKEGEVMTELTVHELEAQHSELLPEREALGFVFIDITKVTQVQKATNVAIGSAFLIQANDQHQVAFVL